MNLDDLRLTFFQALLIGHFLGDFVFQNTWMASQKKARYLPCLVHCVIYTFFVCAMTSWNAWWALAVFLSHFPIDKFGLVDMWLKATRSRSPSEYIEKGHVLSPATVNKLCRDDGPVNLGFRGSNLIALQGGYTAFVSTVVDNFFHIILMLLAARYLVGWGLM